MTRVFRGLFWGAVLAVTILALLPGEYLPGAFDWWDKAQHALAFAVLGVLGLIGYSQLITRIVMGLLLYGAFIELAQFATGWRFGDWQDWLADAIGVGAAYLGWFLWALSRSRGVIRQPYQ